MISLIVTLAVIGLIVWAITALIPMPENIKRLILIVALVCAVFYVLSAFGILGRADIPVPQVR